MATGRSYFEGTTQGATPVTAPYRIVTVASDGTVLAAAEGAGNGILEDPGGVNGATPVAGDKCSVVRSGQTKVYCSAAVTIDDHVTGAAAGATAGQAKVAGSGDVKVAAVISASAANRHTDCVVAPTLGQHSAAP